MTASPRAGELVVIGKGRRAERLPLPVDIGEAIRLDRPDIDTDHGLLVVRDSKFGKSRELALDLTTIAALQRYLCRGDRPTPVEPTDAAFTSATGTRLAYCNVHLAFKRIVSIDDLDAPLIGAFLDHLEHERANSIRTRNARLAAIRSSFKFAAF